MKKHLRVLGFLFLSLFFLSSVAFGVDQQQAAGQAADDSGAIQQNAENGMKDEQKRMDEAKEEAKQAAAKQDKAAYEKAAEKFKDARGKYEKHAADALNAQNAKLQNQFGQQMRKHVMDKGYDQIKNHFAKPDQIADRMTRAAYDNNIPKDTSPFARNAASDYVDAIQGTKGMAPGDASQALAQAGQQNPLGQAVVDNGVMRYAQAQIQEQVSTKLNQLGSTVSGWFSSTPAPAPAPSK